ncbi:aldehyde dehydrogenase family protein [Brevibacterium casei]|nr:aldehyde dehydrogenase family protein [Brevibacterium casei]
MEPLSPPIVPSPKNRSMPVGAAVAAAREWDQVGVLARGTILRRVADILDDRADEVARLMTREHGKTLTDSRIEVAGTVETLHYHSAASAVRTGPPTLLLIRRRSCAHCADRSA